ncbi:hypothetical protein [Goodfellowiella coeruleoviolacea]|uniref:Uncharacterized protein n=1 Tax=Goodfellowiella coeruleoviolacea TaxID=334858 RepID=A0AAE3KGZ8_9PSEU|nr:hypothetical protein [Goodfellowiella coeruleoviolacea]MCP2165949.1 hypothetical protein [Goodfellowiella coeruleoviolacea]
MTGPTAPFRDDSWKTPRIREAEAQLDASMGKARDLLKELEKIKLQPAPSAATEADIQQIQDAARKPDAPRELREMQKKVERGDLNWKDVLEGRAFDDPDVRATVEKQLGQMRAIYEQFEQGYTLDQVIEAREAAERGHHGEDEGGGSILR